MGPRVEQAGPWPPGAPDVCSAQRDCLPPGEYTKEAVSMAGTGTGGGAPNPACRAGRLPGGTDESCLRKEGGKSISGKGAACEKSQRPRRRHGFATCQDFCVLRGEKMDL